MVENEDKKVNSTLRIFNLCNGGKKRSPLEKACQMLNYFPFPFSAKNSNFGASILHMLSGLQASVL